MRNAIGAQFPTCKNTWDGIRKIALPITWFTPIAVRSQRPSARRSDGLADGAFGVDMRPFVSRFLLRLATIRSRAAQFEGPDMRAVDRPGVIRRPVRAISEEQP